MRIGTWNLEGKWTDAHERFLLAGDCAVWLLTEVTTTVVMSGYQSQMTGSLMLPGKCWSAVFSRDPLTPLDDPHFASAMAQVNGITFCSSILPWRSAVEPLWPGASQGERTQRAVNSLLAQLPATGLVWGGDWNHALVGAETTGCAPGQQAILAAVDALGLVVPTKGLRGRREGQLSIDHIAVAAASTVASVERFEASERLSDHDAYIVELADQRDRELTAQVRTGG